ncbi:MAG: hypothetical protein NTW09_05685 [Candidatus Omnitrophica bacterium]|nr:hypothetical protein [Candidatus Omnitrophota bacterium]
MKQRRWDLVHNFEDEHKRRYLKKLSAQDGFRILEGLYQFAVMTNKRIASRKVTKERMDYLVKERARFKRMAL